MPLNSASSGIESKDRQLSVALQCVLFGVSSIGGLLLFQVFASLMGWQKPIWDGGDATAQFLYGLVTLIVGAAPLLYVAVGITRASRTTLDVPATVVVGLVVGVLFRPLQFLADRAFMTYPFLKAMNYLAQILIGLASIALISVVVASFIVVIARRLR